MGICLIWVWSGLSPRVRGNLPSGLRGRAVDRSIPACAGEPFRAGNPERWHKVYPRVCGGTGTTTGRPVAGAGLSPRVRGNQQGKFRDG